MFILRKTWVWIPNLENDTSSSKTTDAVHRKYLLNPKNKPHNELLVSNLRNVATKLQEPKWFHHGRLWVLRVGRSYGPCHMPSSDSACSLHLFPLWMPSERGVQHGMALKRHCRERTNVVFLLIGAHSHLARPLARSASSPQRLKPHLSYDA